MPVNPLTGDGPQGKAKAGLLLDSVLEATRALVQAAEVALVSASCVWGHPRVGNFQEEVQEVNTHTIDP